MNILPPALTHKLAQFFESRNPREKVMLVFLAAAFVFALDYFLLVAPLIESVIKTSPLLNDKKTELSGMNSDKKNKTLIHERWMKTQEELSEKEKLFVSPDEIPALLENLSSMAQNSQVKILSLAPTGTVSAGLGYSKISIRMAAVAGTHEFGEFLSSLETGKTFFKVVDLKINANPTDERHHSIELKVEVYGKSA